MSEEGSKSKNQAKKDKGFQSPKDFKMNAFEPIIPVSTIQKAGEESTFTVSNVGVLRISQATTAASMSIVDQRFNGMYAPAALEESINRISLCGLAKKMVFAVHDDERAKIYSRFSPVRYFKMAIPEPIKEVIEGIGAFEFGGAIFKPRSSTLVIFSNLVRAVGVPGSDGIPPLNQFPAGQFGYNYTFVNRDFNGWKTEVFEEYRDRYNAWTETNHGITILQGGIQFRPPSVQAGFQGLQVWLQNANAPQAVINDVAVAALFEVNLANNAFPTQAQTGGLFGQGLIILNWPKDVIQDRLEYLKRNHLDYVSSIMKHIFKVHEVETFEPQGAKWQMMDVRGNRSVQPFTIPAKDTEMGMLVSNQTVVMINKFTMETTATTTANTRAEIFVNSKML